MSYSDWKEINVNVAQVLLDYDNPRVFIDKPTQENLLRFLVNEEDSIELANSINTNQGLPPAEKPVVILEDGKYVVVEGNRRISACKLLYNRSLLSTNEFNKVPDIDSSMKEYLENLPVVLAPSRDAAEPFITSRHAGEKGIKRWSTIATTKRYINRYRKQESINHIARVLGETPSIVRKGIRFFYFLEYVRNELSWTDEEKRNLEIFKMETTKLDRFLPFSKKAREILKIDFLPNQRITTELPVQNFNAALKDIIERIYLHNEIDTRSTVEEVFDSRVVSMSQRDLNTAKTDMGNGTGEAPKGGTGEAPKGGTGEAPKGGTGEAPKGGTEEAPKGGTTKGATNLEKYTYLTKAYPFTNRYKLNKRINVLIKELKSTKYKENRMGSMYLVRSLLETYTHEYIDYFVHQDGENRLKGVAKDRTKRNQTLRELIFDPIKIHLKKSFPQYEEQIELIDVTFTENNNTAVTRIINFYIHSQTQTPDYQELLDCWKKVSMILDCLDDILATQNSIKI
ncbi:hypothetical protein MMB75_24020 [Paenibacillus sp. P2(2022)]|uniref:hypothetical protein n=1 Tax=Paenibacillus sp. P2(2022) TaxID=2917813 RepID=UPI00240535A9|nr:hypothetical protein [Paenibacillus sp. P2(2022)]MDG0056699.1 hypothetical protein [Paenibacillus sp. P2(2022)]